MCLCDHIPDPRPSLSVAFSSLPDVELEGAVSLEASSPNCEACWGGGGQDGLQKAGLGPPDGAGHFHGCCSASSETTESLPPGNQALGEGRVLPAAW